MTSPTDDPGIVISILMAGHHTESAFMRQMSNPLSG